MDLLRHLRLAIHQIIQVEHAHTGLRIADRSRQLLPEGILLDLLEERGGSVMILGRRLAGLL